MDWDSESDAEEATVNQVKISSKFYYVQSPAPPTKAGLSEAVRLQAHQLLLGFPHSRLFELLAFQAHLVLVTSILSLMLLPPSGKYTLPLSLC